MASKQNFQVECWSKQRLWYFQLIQEEASLGRLYDINWDQKGTQMGKIDNKESGFYRI